ncbi:MULTISPECIES: RnfABCDGE type electron transport complex subunit D [unclassified Treponema]|uniref:RnfABCDGE type electron transport complex subunit D n=1 Tax=unclassified Treponema TaxID=2638727 RepID=UPI0020A4420D|nr:MULTISPECIES: RnfABCDGE type electron transport complex subunit D [unclassified Treponema]UTC68257.1 RnfABCDGE type electron transport complex subunit D [Treponema sp. OMZ 789]UTC70977.1 RnfABCDGE type electron transport complex subunit D [Treponema sp. OMZ 790]UTC73717.1 RnfABCDGE type electron transport complex subunit D [Treponema sp. OMZ 791]
MRSYSNQSLTAAPFVYTRLPVFGMHIAVLSLLSIQILILIITADFYALLNILIAVLGVLAVENVITYSNSSKFNLSLETIISGLLIGFFMPTGIGFIFVFILSAFSVFIVKIAFGGTGRNWINPVALAVCIAYISRPEAFPPLISGFSLLSEKGSFFAVMEANGLVKLKTDFTITSALNSLLLHSVGVTLPEGYISLFLNSTSSIPAFRYNIITLISSIILFSIRVADYILPAAFLASYALLVWAFGMVPVSNAYFAGDILSAVLTGGVLFTSFFVMNEPASSPKTKYGKAMGGIFTGICAFFICGHGASPAGIFFAVILCNIISPLIEILEIKIQAKKRKLYE